MEKKSERLEVRLGYQEKQDFTEACDMQGDTPSGAVRRFINGYVRRSDSDVLASAWRGSAKRKLVPAIAAAAIIGLFAGVTYLVINTSPQASADEIFSFRDINKSGELEFGELGLAPGLDGARSDLLRVLDIDASGSISRAEFVSEGRMVYAVLNDELEEMNPEDNLSATVVEFKFTKEPIQLDTYAGATINAEGFDRLVVWQPKGLPLVMEGGVKISTQLETIEISADEITDYGPSDQTPR